MVSIFFFPGGFSYFCFFSLGKTTQMPSLATPGQSFGFSKEDRGRPGEFLCLSPTGSSKVSHEAPSRSWLWSRSQRDTCLWLGSGLFRPVTHIPWTTAFHQCA